MGSDVSVFRMLMEFDPQAKYTWFLMITGQREEFPYFQGFIRGRTHSQIKALLELLSQPYRDVRIEAAFRCEATEETFQKLFKIIENLGYPEKEYSQVFMVWLDDRTGYDIVSAKI